MENIRYKRNELCLKKMLICLGIFGNLYHLIILIARLLLIFVLKVIDKKMAFEKSNEALGILIKI